MDKKELTIKIYNDETKHAEKRSIRGQNWKIILKSTNNNVCVYIYILNIMKNSSWGYEIIMKNQKIINMLTEFFE